MHDAAGVKLNGRALAPAERIDAILLWSALPGASRHHWGTDLDLIDGNATAAGYQVKLTREEFAPGGPFVRLAQWLETHAARFGFFVRFRACAQACSPSLAFQLCADCRKGRRNLSPSVLRAAIAGAPLLGKEIVLARLDELHARYVATIDWP